MQQVMRARRPRWLLALVCTGAALGLLAQAITNLVRGGLCAAPASSILMFASPVFAHLVAVQGCSS